MTVASHDHPTRTRRLAGAVCCLGLSLLPVACNDDGDGAAPTTSADDLSTTTSTQRSPSSSTTSSTTATTTTPGSTPGTGTGGSSAAEQEVIDRYVGYWTARTAANTGVPNPADPALAEFATGEQLSVVVAETQANLDDGVAFRPADQPINFREVRVVSVDGDSAVVQECVVDDQVIFRRDTDEVVNDAVATRNVRGELTRVDGRWRLARAELIQRWEGVRGCAVGG
jgi:hypothetical protein